MLHSIISILGLAAGLFLAYANGTNDDSKGVASLIGSGVMGARQAILWGAAMTLVGSIAAIWLGHGLIAAFSGKGLVPAQVYGMKAYAVSVGLAAALTVMLASRLGFPISTTHALTGALIGAGLVASLTGVNFSRLDTVFLAPLLVSPALAILGTVLLYPITRVIRARTRMRSGSCLCAGLVPVRRLPALVLPAGIAIEQYSAGPAVPSVTLGTASTCFRLPGIRAGAVLDAVHYLSGGAVSFARGVNDTPKIAAILMAGAGFSGAGATLVAGVAIAVGGILGARRVAQTMAHHITGMNRTQGLVANVVTTGVVLLASRASLPVSTTHVSCGALGGIGAVTRQAHWKAINEIILAWIITLPVGAILGSILFALLKGM